ncbi:MAG: CRISPR-associated endonuclease Cas1 [Bacteroidota bacterium]
MSHKDFADLVSSHYIPTCNYTSLHSARFCISKMVCSRCSTPRIGEKVKKKIPAKKVTSIILDRGTSLTYEAVKTALSHNIDIVFAEGDGAPIGRVWHSKLGSTTKIRKRQLEASMNAECIPWIKEWVTEKVRVESLFHIREGLHLNLSSNRRSTKTRSSGIINPFTLSG